MNPTPRLANFPGRWSYDRDAADAEHVDLVWRLSAGPDRLRALFARETCFATLRAFQASNGRAWKPEFADTVTPAGSPVRYYVPPHAAGVPADAPPQPCDDCRARVAVPYLNAAGQIACRLDAADE